MTTAAPDMPPCPLAVVTVVRDDLPGLLATRASLRAQTWRGFDWLVVDGASTDGTAEWLASSAHEAAWWRSAPDHGLYDAMNAALDRTTADGVLFLNAGDTLAGPDTAATLRDALAADPHAGILYGDALERMPDGTVWRKPARSHTRAAHGMFTHHQAIVYRRSAYPRLRYDTRFAIGADYAFTLRALAASSRVGRLHCSVCVFGPAGASARHARDGRREQARIRREILGEGPIRGAATTAVQALAQAVRDQFPTIYTHMRFGRMERTCLSDRTSHTSATKC